MPVFNDILEHKVLGREYKRGLEEGRKEGREQGLRQGKQSGELTLLRFWIEDRFGDVPKVLDAKLSGMSAAELEQFARRVPSAKTVEELLN